MPLAQTAQHQGPDPQRIAHADHHVLGQRHQGIGALDLEQGMDQPVDDAAAHVGRHQVGDDLCIRRRLEQRAPAHQLAVQRMGIGQVPVMADREAAELEVGEERLDVAQDRLAGGGIADMAHGRMALEPADDGFRGETVGDMAQRPVGGELMPVIGDDADGLLAAMLQGVQAQGAERGGLLGTVDADHAALFLELVVVEGMGADRLGHMPIGCP